MKNSILFIFIFCGIACSQNPFSYKILREYKGNNDYYTNFIYLETIQKIDTTSLKRLIEKFNEDYPNKFSNKAFFLYHNQKYYATILDVKNREKNKVLIGEYVQNEKFLKNKRDSIILEARTKLKMNPKDSIICLCVSPFNPFNVGNVIYKEWATGKYKLPNLNRIPVELETENYFKQFTKYGDTNRKVFTLYYSNPYNDKPYKSLHYINDFGDMIIKDERDPGILSVCRKINY